MKPVLLVLFKEDGKKTPKWYEIIYLYLNYRSHFIRLSVMDGNENIIDHKRSLHVNKSCFEWIKSYSHFKSLSFFVFKLNYSLLIWAQISNTQQSTRDRVQCTSFLLLSFISIFRNSSMIWTHFSEIQQAWRLEME